MIGFSETTVGGTDSNAYCIDECRRGFDPSGNNIGLWCNTADGWGKCVGNTSENSFIVYRATHINLFVFNFYSHILCLSESC